MMKILILAVVGSGLLGGCVSTRAKLLERYEAVSGRLYVLLWGGKANDPEQHASDQAFFECLWEGLESPEEDMRCLVETLEAESWCVEQAQNRGAVAKAVIDECLAPERLACRPSPDFVRVRRTCLSLEGVPDVGTPPPPAPTEL